MRRDVFQAIADPTRREIIGLLAGGPLNLNTVAEKFDVTRPAVSKHVRILTECGLVTVTVKGREHWCEAKLDKLHHVAKWAEQYRKFWMGKLDSLGSYLDEVQAEKPARKKTKRS